MPSPPQSSMCSASSFTQARKRGLSKLENASDASSLSPLTVSIPLTVQHDSSCLICTCGIKKWGDRPAKVFAGEIASTMVNTDLIIMKRAIFYTACLAALAAYVLQGTSFCWDAGSFFADCARCLPSSSKHNAVLITGINQPTAYSIVCSTSRA